jgi:hypothetical protein
MRFQGPPVLRAFPPCASESPLIVIMQEELGRGIIYIKSFLCELERLVLGIGTEGAQDDPFVYT